MPSFIIKIFIGEFLTNLKVVELEHESEPGDLDLQEEIYMEQPLDMFRITLALSVALRNPYMALSKLLELGMPKWIAFSLTLVFLDGIMTPMSIPRK